MDDLEFEKHVKKGSDTLRNYRSVMCKSCNVSLSEWKSETPYIECNVGVQNFIDHHGDVCDY